MAKATPYGRPMVMFRGGYRNRWIYFEADAEAERAATAAMGREMVYAPTGETEPHPDTGEPCTVWKFIPSTGV